MIELNYRTPQLTFQIKIDVTSFRTIIQALTLAGQFLNDFWG